ncbi:MAG: antitoxin [Nocardioides sp.]
MPTNSSTPGPSIQNTLKELADTANKSILEARAKVGALAHDNRGKLAEIVERAGAAIDDKTQGKYADNVAKAKTQALRLVDKVADARPAEPTDPADPAA